MVICLICKIVSNLSKSSNDCIFNEILLFPSQIVVLIYQLRLVVSGLNSILIFIHSIIYQIDEYMFHSISVIHSYILLLNHIFIKVITLGLIFDTCCDNVLFSILVIVKPSYLESCRNKVSFASWRFVGLAILAENEFI